jgi:hypothetical protein
MSKPTHSDMVQSTSSDDATLVTRRSVLAGAAAATTAAATICIDTPVSAQGVDPNSKQDMDAFVILSAALTGVAAGKLAPATDSIEIKQDYFKWVNAKQPAAFASLLQIAKAAALQIPTDPSSGGLIKQDDVDRLVRQIEASEDTKFLARSIVLMWYLGSWYEPRDLRLLTQPNAPRFIGHTVISPRAYTQGWLWRVAQAHPMGYSELQFGYWNREPAPLADFITVRRAKGA